MNSVRPLDLFDAAALDLLLLAARGTTASAANRRLSVARPARRSTPLAAYAAARADEACAHEAQHTEARKNSSRYWWVYELGFLLASTFQ